MKINLIYLLLLAPALALAQGGAFVVQGQLGPNTPTTKAYLHVGEKLDSALVQRGRFSFRGTVAEPEQTILLLARPGRTYHSRPVQILNQVIGLYLEPGTVRITSPDSLPHAVLGGTPLNQAYERLRQATRVTSAQLMAIEDERRMAPADKLRDVAYQAGLDRRAQAPLAAYGAQLRQFIQANPTSLVSLYTLKEYEYGPTTDPAVVASLFAGLAPAVRQSKAGQEYAAQLEKTRQLATGALAPDFTKPDPNGKPLKLSDFRGQYVLVDFWASWCGPCRRENPRVVATYQQYKNRNFTVLGVSLDQLTGRTAWLKAIEADGLPWKQVSDLKGWASEVVPLYGLQEGIPQNFLIGPDGRIVARNLMGEALNQKLAAVLPAAAP